MAESNAPAFYYCRDSCQQFISTSIPNAAWPSLYSIVRRAKLVAAGKNSLLTR
jgi:hypothetical protein